MAAGQGVSVGLGNHPLGAVDTALAESPLHLGQLELSGGGFLDLAGVVEVKDLDAVLREEVGDAGDGAVAADGHGGHEPVTLPCEGEELGGVKLGADAGDLGDSTAGELNTDDVGVLAQAREHVRVDIEASGDTGEVVDDDGDGAGVGELLEEADDGLLVHGEVEVARDKDKSVIGASGLGQLGLIDDGAGGLATAAHGDGEIGTTGLDGNLSCGLDESGLLIVGEGDSLAVGASQDDCGPVRFDPSWLFLGITTYLRGGQTSPRTRGAWSARPSRSLGWHRCQTRSN